MMPKKSVSDNRMSKNVPFASNSIRLSGLEWIVVTIICLATFHFAPALWGQLGELTSGPDYRLPYKLGGDYWLYSRLCERVCSQYEIVLVGDSVIWGHYVPPDGTLSHFLNENVGRDRFATLGVDGFHPAALWGLVRFYGRDIADKKVILHLNPLWMSGEKQDLQTEKEFRFQHPRLVPQFKSRIPCYKESWSERVSIAIGRRVGFLGWTAHLRTTYFENMDVPAWTIEHPYENPLRQVAGGLATSEEDYPRDKRSWIQRKTAKQELRWVELETSLQWKLFRQTLDLLKERNNTVFVLVGPFNEHMLKAASADVYRKMKKAIESWLRENSIPCFMPDALPSDFYSDASHPLAEGYALLAQQLFENESFQSSILGKQ
ncbi:MAG: SGNH/GDSL hydrolase family protein [Planctomycetota bacterium]|jgi:hypothetical protein